MYKRQARRAARLGAKIFGVNHRNLHDLSIDLGRCAQLAVLAPADSVIVAESGIRDVETVRRLGAHANGFLVGSQLTSQPDVDRAARELVYGPNKVCGLRSGRAAQVAKAAGAVYGGLIFEAASRRNVSRETATEIIAAEPGLNFVAVSRRTTDFAQLLVDGISALQLHAPYQGSLEAEHTLIAQARAAVGEGKEIWRAISMTQPEGPTIAKALAEPGSDADKLVLDAHGGGSGHTFDWDTIPAEVKAMSLLAGGIGPANVTEALAVGCAGVDLNSAVEYPATAGTWAGYKDAAAVRQTFDTIANFHYPTTSTTSITDEDPS